MVEVLTHKYLGNAFVLTCTPKPNAYPTCRSIRKAVMVLRDGFKFRLGSGEIFFLYDAWLEEGPLCQLVDVVNISDTALRVKDL